MKQILLIFLLSLCACMGARAGDRVALVIGCNRYTNLSEGKQLTSPVADATDVAATLKALGYTLITGEAVTDASRDSIVTATENFTAQASGADAAVFYFSGHGIQVGDDNFLMPSDTPKLTSYSLLKNRGVQLRDTVMVALEEAQAKTKVIILDCCRENPFADQVDEALGKIGKSLRTKGGLGEISGYGPGFFLAFATSPGTIADDGNGARNSPFTAALLMHLKTSAADDITPLFRKVKATVRESSGQAQVPWTHDSLDAAFVFDADALSTAIQPLPPSVITPADNISPPKPAPAQAPDPILPATGHFHLTEVFDGTPYDAYNSYSRGRILTRAQERLRQANFYRGHIDGRVGPGTQTAIVEWQKQQGLSVTGKLDAATLSSMGLTAIVEGHPAPEQISPARGNESRATQNAGASKLRKHEIQSKPRSNSTKTRSAQDILFEN